MNKHKYLEDIQDIKEMMNRSSRFISLSGMSGVCAGVFSLIGVYLAYDTIYSGQNYMDYRVAIITDARLIKLIVIAGAVVFLSIIAGIYFTTRKAKKLNQKLWDHHTKRYLINLSIPLITGGVVCFILLIKGYISIIAPLTLIFYGLGLINASHFTLKETKSLGLMEVALGILALNFIGYGLIFWAFGFGVLHILYGMYMHVKS